MMVHCLGEETFYKCMIKSVFNRPISLAYDLHNCFLAFFLPLGFGKIISSGYKVFAMDNSLCISHNGYSLHLLLLQPFGRFS